MRPWLTLLAGVLAAGCGKPELSEGRWVDLEETGSGGILRNIAVSSTGRVYVASRPRVLRSTGPLSFEEVGEGQDISLVAVDLQDHVYAATELYSKSSVLLHTSFDGGDTWSATGVPSGFAASAIAGDPTVTSRVYMVASNNVGDGGLFRSDDSGVTFVQVSTLGGALAVDGDGSVYLARSSGIWRSVDLGGTFLLHSAEPAGDNLAPRFLLTDPGQSGHLILGTQDGLYTSSAGGTVWSRSDPGVTNSGCTVIYQNAARVPGSPNEIYMAVNAAGIYHSADNGATWQARNQGLGSGCLTPLGIGVVAGTDTVVYTTILGPSPNTIFAYLAE
jgi:hypothetical protein